MLKVTVTMQNRVRRLWERREEQRGGVDDILLRGLFVVAVLGIAAAMLAYYTGLNNWISNKLQQFMNTY